MLYTQLISPALWLIGGGTAALYAVRSFLAGRGPEPDPIGKRYAKRAIIAAAVAVVVVPGVAVIPAGSRGVVYSLSGGVEAGERQEGVTLVLPWVQHVTAFNVRTQKVYSDKIYAQSLDLQEITVVASVNYHVDPNQAAELFQKVGPDYQNTVILPALFQRMKLAVGKIVAEDFAANREQLALDVRTQMQDQLSSYGIIVDYVNIEDAIFDPTFIEAVKNKVIADQIAQEQFRLIAAEQNKKTQAIIQAKGRARSVLIEAMAQAQANGLIAKSITNGIITWKLLSTWNGILPTTLITQGGGALTFLVNPSVPQQI